MDGQTAVHVRDSSGEHERSLAVTAVCALAVIAGRFIGSTSICRDDDLRDGEQPVKMAVHAGKGPRAGNTGTRLFTVLDNFPRMEHWHRHRLRQRNFVYSLSSRGTTRASNISPGTICLQRAKNSFIIHGKNVMRFKAHALSRATGTGRTRMTVKALKGHYARTGIDARDRAWSDDASLIEVRLHTGTHGHQ